MAVSSSRRSTQRRGGGVTAKKQSVSLARKTRNSTSLPSSGQSLFGFFAPKNVGANSNNRQKRERDDDEDEGEEKKEEHEYERGRVNKMRSVRRKTGDNNAEKKEEEVSKEDEEMEDKSEGEQGKSEAEKSPANTRRSRRGRARPALDDSDEAVAPVVADTPSKKDDSRKSTPMSTPPRDERGNHKKAAVVTGSRRRSTRSTPPREVREKVSRIAIDEHDDDEEGEDNHDEEEEVEERGDGEDSDNDDSKNGSDKKGGANDSPRRRSPRRPAPSLKFKVGTNVRKNFEGYGWYDGKVEKFDPPYYVIRFTDGETEDMSEDEVERHLSKPPTKQRVPRSKATSKTTDKKEDEPVAKKARTRDPPSAKKPLKKATAKKQKFDDVDDDNDGDEDFEFQDDQDDEDSAEMEDIEDDDDDNDDEKKVKKRSSKSPSAWGSLSRNPAPKTKRKPPAPKATAKKPQSSKRKNKDGDNADEGRWTSSGMHFAKAAYLEGDDLPVLANPQDMFDDMIARAFEAEPTAAALASLVQLLRHRTLRVATMCSGTESPILALDMISKSLEYHVKRRSSDETDAEFCVRMEHVFSCEIEPFKQAYIERNFHPPLLFRDVRELGKNLRARTAYGSMAEVPATPGTIDLLVAGTSCVDYSNLNAEKNNVGHRGESGQTFRGMRDWVVRAQPTLIVLENVQGAPWSKIVEEFQSSLGYYATFIFLDTKKYYIPHTRSRGYFFAVRKDLMSPKKDKDKKKKQPSSNDVTDKWTELVKSLQRPASASLDSFMFANDDPRVLRGRSRLSSSSAAVGGVASDQQINRVDWTRCELRHLYARSSEALGDKRPLTGWSESGNVAMPSFAWNEWTNAQVHRIHDLMDINTLRLAQTGTDNTYKTMVWNLSQNVDRDTMGKLGLCQCLTPTGVPYVTNRGGPLVGEELLLLQGIPAHDLLLTKESEDQLKDLAGNAMTTTVVGASILSALLCAQSALRRSAEIYKSEEEIAAAVVPSLVPRAIEPSNSVIQISQRYGTYDTNVLRLGAKLSSPSSKEKDSSTFSSITDLLEAAHLSARMCISEGRDLYHPLTHILECRDCGMRCSVASCTPPRKFEEHSFQTLSDTSKDRISPATFRQELLDVLPMRVALVDLVPDQDDRGDVDAKLWPQWRQAFKNAVESTVDDEAAEFRFTDLKRSSYWTVIYTTARGARLELRISNKSDIRWLLFAKAPSERGTLRDSLARPLARMVVPPEKSGKDLTCLLDGGTWQVCMPQSTGVDVTLKGEGELVESWEASLGLGEDFAKSRRYQKIRIAPKGDDDAAAAVKGLYQFLPKCGGACGSMHKKIEGDGPNVFFFLESGRCTQPTADSFVFAPTMHRTDYDEYREVLMQLEAGFRPSGKGDPDEEQVVVATIPGKWVDRPEARLKSVFDNAASWTAPSSDLHVPLEAQGWKKAAEVLSCQVPVHQTGVGDLLMSYATDDSAGTWLSINLHKSKLVFDSLAFVLARLSVPTLLTSWNAMTVEEAKSNGGVDLACSICAPTKPGVQWTSISRGNKIQYVPQEDTREAAVYEKALKQRPASWQVQVQTVKATNDAHLSLRLRFGCNAVGLVQRALGLIPPQSLARQTALQFASDTDIQFEWRVVPHVDETDKTRWDFRDLVLTSNKKDPLADQPPNFAKHKLRPEQRRSLSWMLSQEANTSPMMEEEVTEAILPTLNWRAEGRVRRPVLVRGGIAAHEVGFGKTPLTLALIDAAPEVHGPPPEPPSDYQESHLFTNATLIIVPTHLMGQWPKEVGKFLGDRAMKRLLVVKTMADFNKCTVGQIQKADMVIVSFTVLSSALYYERLARLAGANARSLPAGAKSGGEFFRAIYKECRLGLEERVRAILSEDERDSVFEDIEDDAYDHAQRLEDDGTTVCLDRKKAAYRNRSEDAVAAEGDENEADADSKKKRRASTGGRLRRDGVNDKLPKKERDPWQLSDRRVRNDISKMLCPPLELFYWNRLVLDEFHYLFEKSDRARVLELVLGLRCSFRWFLSGTPPHKNFKDIQTLSSLLGLHLGVDDSLPGAKVKRRGGSKDESDKTAFEKFSSLLEVRSIPWHERRHRIGQDFLHRFVRQNVAEIDEIRCEEHLVVVDLPPAERAIYLELETHLKSLDMNSRRAIKHQKASQGDREARIQKVLEGSEDAEEALVKRCAYFELPSSGVGGGKGTSDVVINLRREQMQACVNDLKRMLSYGLRQRQLILEEQPDWEGMRQAEKGEVQDRLGTFLENVRDGTAGGDDEISKQLRKTLKEATDAVAKDPTRYDIMYTVADDDDEDAENDIEGSDEDDDSDLEAAGTSRKRKRSKGKKTKKKEKKEVVLGGEEELYDKKWNLREHVNKIHAILKELGGRIRSLRFFQEVRKIQTGETTIRCPRGDDELCSCKDKLVPQMEAGVLSSCGHAGCLGCLRRCADKQECVEPSCKMPIQESSIVSASDLGVDSQQDEQLPDINTKYGAKLTAIIEKVKSIVKSGDRVIVFAQFQDLKEKIANALDKNGVASLQVKGGVNKQVHSLDVIQKEVPDKGDPRVLLLTMDHESSAGVNLTTCNHAIFVHPLLSDTAEQYEAYETQAIGRIRRYGQTKTVHVWRFFARHSIDSDVYKERTGVEVNGRRNCS